MPLNNRYISPNDIALSNFVKALALPVRICIVRFILEHGNSIKREKLAEVPYNRTTVNQHVNELKHLGIVKSETKDKEVIYSVNESVFIKMSNHFLSLFEPIRQLNDEANAVFSKPKIKQKRIKETTPTQVIGEYIREKRKSARLSQAELAARIMADRAWISKIETNKQPLRPEKLGALADALSVPLAQLRRVYYESKINQLTKEGLG